jgi:HJR/Mrr/RecB family endonuclease
MSMPPDVMEITETRIRAMKKPFPEDFGITGQECTEAKDNLTHFKRKSENLGAFFELLGGIIGAIIIFTEIARVYKPSDSSGILLITIVSFIIIIYILGKLNDIVETHRLNKKLSKPIYRKIKLYESALNHYVQTTEQYWKSLRGVDFETALGGLYRSMGYWVRHTKGSGDEGIDLILEKEGVRTVVQCKGHTNPVGVGVVRELYGAMMHFGAPSAVLACPAGFTEGVMRFVRGKPIKLVSSKEIIEMVENIC